MAKQTSAAPAASKELSTQTGAADGGKAVVTYDEKTLAMLDAGNDYADIGRADVALPFLSVLQALSPACSIGHADYNPDARPGMIIHSITKELFTNVIVTPVVYKRSYIEWVPRKDGGGFRGEFPVETHEAIYNKLRDPETGKGMLENGNELLETLTFFVMHHAPDGGISPAIVAMALTQTRAAKVWNQMQMNYVPPGAPRKLYKRYTASYALTTEMRRKDQNTWFVWKVLGANPNPPEAIGAAQGFEMQVRGNAVVVDYSAGAEPVDTAGAAGGSTSQM